MRPISGKNKHDSDEELMLRLLKREREAFSELYDRYAGEMVRFFYHRLGRDEARAQDFLHDLFLKLLNDPEKYTPGSAFRPWFYSIAMNMCRNEYRSRKVKDAYRKLHESGIPAGTVMPERIDLDSFGKELQAKLHLLDEAHREVFLLRYREELPLAEIAVIMGIPEGTVKSRLFYTLKTLSAQLNVFHPLIN
jgi:RNA polymerase sigma-70 factor (ECF subfamily)